MPVARSVQLLVSFTLYHYVDREKQCAVIFFVEGKKYNTIVTANVQLIVDRVLSVTKA